MTTSMAGDGLSKIFSRRRIFSDVGFSIHQGEALAITGRNGSGKSTLLKILAGVLSPTKGTVKLTVQGEDVPASWRFRQLGFVAPYLQLYDEFSGWENLELCGRIRGMKTNRKECNLLLTKVGLLERAQDPVRTYSSGMKQRLKYAFALLHHPPALLLDEPRSNLDAEGIGIVYSIIEEQKRLGFVIIATTDEDDLGYCGSRIDLNERSRVTS